jgi:hypothetical protein
VRLARNVFASLPWASRVPKQTHLDALGGLRSPSAVIRHKYFHNITKILGDRNAPNAMHFLEFSGGHKVVWE